MFLKVLIFKLIKKFISKIRFRETYAQKAKRLMPKYPTDIFFDQKGNDKLKQLLEEKTNVLISRLGAVELSAICCNLRYNNYLPPPPFYLRSNVMNKEYDVYPEEVKNTLRNNAGFFPVNDNSIDDFCELYLTCIKSIDSLGVWFNENEWDIINMYCNKALLVELECLNSFLYKNPYTSILEGKTVLVIHPFIESIKNQYMKRKLIFKDVNVLPDFNLLTIRAPQTLADNTDGYKSWFDAFNKTCSKILNIDFDIAIIGSGAYGLPIASYIKTMGKTAIHLGGATQLLFGIKGKRWETEYNYDKILFNEHWIYPSENEKPNNYIRIENGCYW